MRVMRSVDIAAPPEKIWPLLVEPENVLKWCITFRKFEYPSEQRSGVGTHLYVEEKVSPMPLMKLNFTVTEWRENEKIAFKMTSGTRSRGYDQSWTIDTNPTGSRFTFVENFVLPLGVIGKLINPLAERSSGATVERMLVILKSLAEE